jgi:hypothetical protein
LTCPKVCSTNTFKCNQRSVNFYLIVSIELNIYDPTGDDPIFNISLLSNNSEVIMGDSNLIWGFRCNQTLKTWKNV